MWSRKLSHPEKMVTEPVKMTRLPRPTYPFSKYSYTVIVCYGRDIVRHASILFILHIALCSVFPNGTSLVNETQRVVTFPTFFKAH
jgi:hypothetical protein